jgi:UPF0716 protein FxsA
MGLMVLVLFGFFSYWEFQLLRWIGQTQGYGSVILLCLGSAFFGISMVRQQGAVAVSKVRDAVFRGTVPTVEVVSGLILLVAGLFFFVPGFLSDAVGLVLLLPIVRRVVARRIIAHFRGRVVVAPGGGGAAFGARFYRQGGFPGSASSDPDFNGTRAAQNPDSPSSLDVGVLDIEAEEVRR